MRSGDAVVGQTALPGQWLCKKILDFIFRSSEALFWNQGKQGILPLEPAKTGIFARVLCRNTFDNFYHLDSKTHARAGFPPQNRMESGQISAKRSKNRRTQNSRHHFGAPTTRGSHSIGLENYKCVLKG